MEASFQLGLTRSPGIVGSLISVAIVFSGAAASAGGLTGYGATAEFTPVLIGQFSDGDLEQLEHATAADGTAVRLAAMMESLGAPEEQAPSLASARLDPATAANDDLFPHSGRLLPLLTMRPDASPAIVSGPSSFRPGPVQPVGVPQAAVRIGYTAR